MNSREAVQDAAAPLDTLDGLRVAVTDWTQLLAVLDADQGAAS